MDTLEARLIVEGSREDATLAQQQQAWSHLIGTGLCWELQGWYGRTARGLIEAGEFSPAGEILNPGEDDE